LKISSNQHIAAQGPPCYATGQLISSIQCVLPKLEFCGSGINFESRCAGLPRTGRYLFSPREPQWGWLSCGGVRWRKTIHCLV